MSDSQMIQQQMQAMLMQREQINMQLMELKNAIQELEKSSEKEVYKIAGPVLVKKPRADVLADLKEKEELLSMRMKSLEKAETKTKEQMDELRKKPASKQIHVKQ